MKPVSFEYLRPQTIAEALDLLEKYGEQAKIIAGGQSLVPMMNLRVVRPSMLIDINRLEGADYIRFENSEIRIGALVRHAALHNSPLIREHCPLMYDAYRYVAHGPIRNRGTLCGNLCHADPASEMPAVMLAAGATMHLSSRKGQRTVPASDFFKGLFATAARPDEILVEVRVPSMPSTRGWGFQEVSVRKGDFAMALVATLLDITEGKITSAALAFAGVSDRATRISVIERMLIGHEPSDRLFKIVGEEATKRIEVADDVHADHAYRSDLLRTLTCRALTEASGRTGTLN